MGAVGLLAQLSENPIFKPFVGDAATQTEQSALFILLGLALLFIRLAHTPCKIRIGRLLALTAAILGLGLLLSQKGGPHLAGSFVVIVLGMAITLLPRPSPRHIKPTEWLAYVGGFAPAVTVIGYLFGYDIRTLPYFAMPLQAAVVGGLLALGILSATPGGAFAQTLFDKGAPRILVRRVLPTVILVPLALGHLSTLAYQYGYATAPLAQVLYTTLVITLLASVVWLGAQSTRQVDALRAQAQKNLAKINLDLECRIQAATEKLARTNQNLKQEIAERTLTQDREQTRTEILESLATGASLSQSLALLVASVEKENTGICCSIMRVDEHGRKVELLAAPSLTDYCRAAANGFALATDPCPCAEAARTGKIIQVPDIAREKDIPHEQCAALAAGFRTVHSRPLVSRNGNVLGIANFYLREQPHPESEESQLIHSATQLANLAMERGQAEYELRLASSVFQASDEAIVITDADNHILAVNPAYTRITGYLPGEVQGKQPTLLKSGYHEDCYYQEMWDALRQDGSWQGEIWDRRKNGELFPKWLTINAIHDENGHVQRHVAIFSDITERKRAEETILHQANHDALTGLPNRRLFHDRLEQEVRKTQRNGTQLALIFIDLDQFKDINDSLGHDYGDNLLVQAAARIVRSVREADTVARLGGDEFTVILSDLDDGSVVEIVARKLIQALSDPFDLGTETGYVSASIGITLFPSDAADAQTLIKNADQAMYKAKRDGRNRFSYFTPAMQQAAQHRLHLHRDLSAALAENQFEMHFQPILELDSGKVSKAEALIRWHHPQRGTVSPAEFIPIAEDVGLISAIGGWGFRHSVLTARNWMQSGLPPLEISVNKSPRQFFSNDPEGDWVDFLASVDHPGELVTVEITEGLLLDARQEVSEKLRRYRDAGLRIAVDDFGTGYSSLSYLKKFPIDYLKIDRSFIKDLSENANDRALVEAIVVMAHKLGIQVIAEGVERTDQRDILMDMGCNFVQGYLYAKPMSARDLENYRRGITP